MQMNFCSEYADISVIMRLFVVYIYEDLNDDDPYQHTILMYAVHAYTEFDHPSPSPACTVVRSSHASRTKTK